MEEQSSSSQQAVLADPLHSPRRYKKAGGASRGGAFSHGFRVTPASRSLYYSSCPNFCDGLLPGRVRGNKPFSPRVALGHGLYNSNGKLRPLLSFIFEARSQDRISRLYSITLPPVKFVRNSPYQFSYHSTVSNLLQNGSVLSFPTPDAEPTSLTINFPPSDSLLAATSQIPPLSGLSPPSFLSSLEPFSVTLTCSLMIFKDQSVLGLLFISLHSLQGSHPIRGYRRALFMLAISQLSLVSLPTSLGPQEPRPLSNLIPMTSSPHLSPLFLLTARTALSSTQDSHMLPTRWA